MKRHYLLLLLTLLLVSCSDESTVKDTVTGYLKKQMKNPDSFKIESIEVRKDTIPAFLSQELLSLAEDASDAMEDYNRYKEMSYLWADEKYKSSQKFLSSMEILQTAYDNAVKETPSVEYVAYVKYSGTNAMGGTVSNRSIIIVDNKDPKKILGSFDIDKEFIEKFLALKYICSKGEFELKQNKFGKFETDGLPYIEQFIINEEE